MATGLFDPLVLSSRSFLVRSSACFRGVITRRSKSMSLAVSPRISPPRKPVYQAILKIVRYSSRASRQDLLHLVFLKIRTLVLVPASFDGQTFIETLTIRMPHMLA
jgi:hypothetical protein